ncbi:hypothetical protein QBC38DRAFT_486869 [Podospora fimiseda]|uniref:Uncharacterized protein n=1 Tax=Podospora fimiseda TaxID=252190 RepID=A0AAN7BID5_9PEZI|nr:hypothetical protein QBC38DRAFT_486869 [Podospora fimiseda]
MTLSTVKKLFIIALGTLVTSIAARDIRFHVDGGCYDTAYNDCQDAAAGQCCTAGSPFCAYVECYACELGNDVYSFNRASCTGGATNSCREGADAHCCIGAGNGNTCAGNWEVGGGRKKARFGRMAESSESSTNRDVMNEVLKKKDEECKAPAHNATAFTTGPGGIKPVDLKDCEVILKPNRMGFKNRKGKMIEIHIPTGTYERALELFRAENWEELEKFPAYTGQKYTAADYIIQKKPQD